jgi:hypothetical protein
MQALSSVLLCWLQRNVLRTRKLATSNLSFALFAMMQGIRLIYMWTRCM